MAENHPRLVGMGTNGAQSWQETHGMLGERLGKGKKQMSRYLWEMLCNRNTHITCRVGAQKCFDTPNSSAPNGTIVFPEAVKPYHRWSPRNTIKNSALSSTMSSSHPPVSPKNIQLQGFSQQRRVWDLWPLATLTSRSDLWRSRFNKNNRSWGRVFKILWLKT